MITDLQRLRSARLRDDAARLAPFAADPRARLVIEVGVEEAYLHCAKSLLRSKLGSAEARVERSVLPTMGHDQRAAWTCPTPGADAGA